MKEYDYLIVGAGLYGAVMAHELKKKGKKCLVIDRRDHIAGNIYCEDIEGIHVHKYGAHIFHTSDKKIWDYMNQFAEFNNYINSPVAVYKDELYNLPFNMNTFSKMWNIRTPQEAKEIIEKQHKKAHYIVCDTYVTMTDGTGIVHIAPAFGEDDSRIGRNYELPFVQFVDGQGNLTKETPYAGVFVKKADSMVLTDLDKEGKLFDAPKFEHDYPHCWRCDTPLIYLSLIHI